jgi:hypothetical protein
MLLPHNMASDVTTPKNWKLGVWGLKQRINEEEVKMSGN